LLHKLIVNILIFNAIPSEIGTKEKVKSSNDRSISRDRSRVEAIENKNLEETVLDGACHSGATRDVGSADVELQLSMFDQEPLLETTIGIGLF
jgi:hypothetical protein